MGSSGRWMVYSAMSDAIMMNSLMRSNSYYYEPRVVVANGNGVIVRSERSSALAWIFGIIGLLVVGGIVIAVINSSKKEVG